MFVDTKLAKVLADEETILRKYGPDNGRHICQRLADLLVGPNY